MTRLPFNKSLRWVLFGLGASALLVACAVTPSDICEAICDCTGCSDNELAACIDDLEDEQRLAEREGCDEEYDAVLSCFDDEIECRGSGYDLDGCDGELEDLDKCFFGTGSVGPGGGGPGSGGPSGGPGSGAGGVAQPSGGGVGGDGGVGADPGSGGAAVGGASADAASSGSGMGGKGGAPPM